jgi:serine phosphatase RsbU (regulator of sigma subunit)/anti-sigma regulatory factor (Ser/Thr protein kinase)
MAAESEDLARHVTRARERVLEGEPVHGGVRGLILSSWQRCQSLGLPADRLELPYQPDQVDYDSRLRYAALPVLDRVELLLSGNRMSVILTDAKARVTERRAGDPSLNHRLDEISLAPGFSYAEDFAGTNGIGTALTEKRAYGVFGGEHFSDRLQPFSCAGTPIRDPFTGRIVGILDLTCMRADANGAMSDVSRQAAADIERRLLELGSEQERALLHAYFRAESRTKPSGLVLGGESAGVATGTAASVMSGDDQLVLSTKAAEMIAEARRAVSEVPLSRGRVATLLCRPLDGPAGTPGAVVEVRVRDLPPEGDANGSALRSAGSALFAATGTAAGTATGTVRRDSPSPLLFPPSAPPDLAGSVSTATTDSAPSAAEAETASGDVWLLLAGEADVGRLAVEARHRLDLLYQASVCIGTTLDVSRTAEELAELVVPRFADIVTVDVFDTPGPDDDSEDPLLRRNAIRGIKPGMPFRTVGEPVSFASSTSQARSLASGRAVLESDPASMARRGGRGADARMAPLTGVHSMITAPLRARGAVLGLVTFYRIETPGRYDMEDLAFAEELTARTALPVDNARRFARERATALALQRSMLPRDVAELSAVDVAYRYLPAHASVGGDWFDVIRLSGSRVALVVGDVVGHGVHAAATMGRLRTAVHNFAALDLPPGELLASLDDLVCALDRAEGAGTFDGFVGATCLYLVYDPVTRRCVMARAGHLLPVLVHPDGTVRFPELPPGPPLGLGGLPFESVELELTEGSLLALYTDGLVEARDRDIDVGLNMLGEALARPTGSLEESCQAVVETLLPAHPGDDVALLLARTRTLGAGKVMTWDLPFDPAIVAPTRAAVARTLQEWDLHDAVFTSELMVSELVTNAIRHAGGPLQLRLIRDDTDCTLIYEMSDGSQTSPRLRRADSTDENGRGLFLVAHLAERWGTRYTERGKTIWAEHPLRPGERRTVPCSRPVRPRRAAPLRSATNLW